jgi:hypothetical protein
MSRSLQGQKAVPKAQSRVLERQSHGVADGVIIPVLTEFFI